MKTFLKPFVCFLNVCAAISIRCCRRWKDHTCDASSQVTRRGEVDWRGEARVVGHDVSCIMIPLYDADADCDDVVSGLIQERQGWV